MSKAYYFVRNFTYPELLNIMCYCTKFPQSLTSTQRATRLYRTFLRRQYAINHIEPRSDSEIFHRQVNQATRDFKRILDVAEDSSDYISTMDKYETWVGNHIDPTMIINESRSYSANSNKYFVFSNEMLDFDPHGYYKPRNVAGRNPGEGFMYYADYPQNNDHWIMHAPLFEADEREQNEARQYSNSK